MGPGRRALIFRPSKKRKFDLLVIYPQIVDLASERLGNKGMNMKNKSLSYALAFAFMVLAVSVYAQGGPPPPPPPPPPAPPQVPIDGGIFLLFASGLAYGAKKLYSR